MRILTVATMGLCLSLSPALAQTDDTGEPTETPTSPIAEAVGATPAPETAFSAVDVDQLSVERMLAAPVVSADDESLGRVADVLIGPGTDITLVLESGSPQERGARARLLLPFMDVQPETGPMGRLRLVTDVDPHTLAPFSR